MTRLAADQQPHFEVGAGWTAVVLAAGRGTRMRSALPKPLHPVAGRPMVHLVCDALEQIGLRDIVVVSGEPDDEVARSVQERARIAVQEAPLGTGHAALAARGVAGEASNVLVLHADLPLVTVRTLRELIERHVSTASDLTFLTAYLEDPTGYGRIVRRNGRLQGIVEEADADAATRGEPEVNAGLYAARAEWLWPALEAVARGPQGEIYLTDIIGLAVSRGAAVQTYQVIEAAEVQQVNTRVELARAEQIMRDRIRRRLMEGGVTLIDPATTFVDAGVTVGPDTTLLPGVHLLGQSTIGAGCRIGPNAVIRDCTVGDGSEVAGSTLQDSVLEDGVSVGPYCLVRNGSHLERGVRVGTHAEVKASRVGRDSNIRHFSYVGDTEMGANVNIGAGTITANYDGVGHYRTRIGDGAFIGSDSVLIAPIAVGDGGRTAAGAIVTRDVAAGETVMGVPARPRGSGEAGNSGEATREG